MKPRVRALCGVLAVVNWVLFAPWSIADAVADCTVSGGTEGVAQGTNWWCWAACIEYIEIDIGCQYHWSQCDLANWFVCRSPVPPFPTFCGWCCRSSICDGYMALPTEIQTNLNALGFNAGSIHPAANSSAGAQGVANYLCTGFYLYSWFTKEGLNHAGVVVKIEDDGLGGFSTLSDLWVMDPASGVMRITNYCFYFNAATNPVNGGGHVWELWMPVWKDDESCPKVGISDINHFVYDSQDWQGIHLKYGISATADSTDSAAVYVADNPTGPARLIPESVCVPTRDNLNTPSYYEENNFTDQRGPWDDVYFYYLNHGPGPFERVMMPSDLFPLEGDSVSWYYPMCEILDPPYCDRPHLAPPDDVTVSDVPLDFGGTLSVAWDLSTDDETIDYYNIFRESSFGGVTEGFEYLASVSAGTSAYFDTLVVQPFSYRYEISSAHHGTWGTGAGEMYGLWNDLSEPSAPAVPVDDLEEISFAPTGLDSLGCCPKGDGDTLRVSLTVLGSDGFPTADIPAEEILFFLSRPSVATCSTDTFAVGTCEGDTLQAARATDSNGTTELFYSAIKGCGTFAVTSQVMGKMLFDTLTVLVRSPDIDGNGSVALPDFSRFAFAYNTSCGNPSYCTCADFDLNCHVSLADLSIFASHYCNGSSNCAVHACGSSGGSMIANAWSAPAQEVPEGVTAAKPTFEIGSARERRLEDGRVSIPVTLKEVSSLLACHVVIGYEGSVTSAEFLATEYLHDPVVIPARVDDAKKTIMVALAATGGAVTRSAEGVLGALTVEGTIVPHSLEIVEAAILDGNHRLVSVVESAALASGRTAADEGAPAPAEIRETKLYQSYPNPSNPVTTISFSLKERSLVTLRIFSVSGHLVRTLVNEELGPEVHRVVWDGRDERGTRVSSGIYFCRLEAPGFVDQKKLVILK